MLWDLPCILYSWPFNGLKDQVISFIFRAEMAIEQVYVYGWSNKPPPLVWKMPSRLFKYRWASLASKEGAFTKKYMYTELYDLT